MSCQLKNITLDPLASGETWGGLTFTIDGSPDTAYASALSRVRMSWKGSAGSAVLTLDSDVGGEITIDSSAAYAWEFTIEPRALSLAAGFYTWAIETTDGGGVVDKDLLSGTQQITIDPHS